MTEDNKPKNDTAYVDPLEHAALDSAPDGTGGLQALQEEHAALHDQLLRALADMENMRRRHEKALKDTSVYAVTQFAKEILSVADTLRVALAHSPTDSTDPFVQGISMTERNLHSVLEKFGIKEIVALHTPFDPQYHEALMEIPDASRPQGTVVQVLEVGYTIGDRLLRPSKVAISKI